MENVITQPCKCGGLYMPWNARNVYRDAEDKVQLRCTRCGDIKPMPPQNPPPPAEARESFLIDVDVATATIKSVVPSTRTEDPTPPASGGQPAGTGTTAGELVAGAGERLESAWASLEELRSTGWSVAVHNDYRLNGRSYTFWLFTRDGYAVKGEGATDAEAIAAARANVNLLADNLEELEASKRDKLDETRAQSDAAEQRAKGLEAACKAVEEWWLREGMKLPGMYGAPGCIFEVRAALAKGETRQLRI